ncbi:hypothetical protein HMPREF9418_2685 [Neisseria macacae ATCC 33926]|uniref:Uncharacterized protein n=1 Tax=Neisseria macacae ATCC 33926 TaxID=997348 RepID=A0AA36UGM1_9NEIS|nr:hypothetical protein HMPREF9418_2685 [Neisseria macacae ATCC 33926]
MSAASSPCPDLNLIHYIYPYASCQRSSETSNWLSDDLVLFNQNSMFS